MGSPEAESTGAGREGETAAGPRPNKARRGSRAPRPSHDHRDARQKEGPRGDRRPPETGARRPGGGILSGEAVPEWKCVSSRVHVGGVFTSSE